MVKIGAGYNQAHKTQRPGSGLFCFIILVRHPCSRYHFSRATWLSAVREAAGKINSKDYTVASAPHPAMVGYKEGQLLLGSISGGNRTVNASGQPVYMFELELLYRIVGETNNDWQYIYRKDTAAYDKPKQSGTFLYETSLFEGF